MRTIYQRHCDKCGKTQEVMTRKEMYLSCDCKDKKKDNNKEDKEE